MTHFPTFSSFRHIPSSCLSFLFLFPPLPQKECGKVENICSCDEVFVVDNYFTGRKRNIEQWLGHQNFEMLHHDIVNPLYLEARICIVNN